ncbi:MAG: DNA translocase FtsK 4TM domain-containing protein, partial [Polaromonas sp.]|nr:DNA translocase FtsK 4TM domain-containing protein [Gemmatimonadaceae bacterium]
MGSTGLRRELAGIALLLFAVFLAGALAAYGLAELRTGISVRANVGWLGYWLARPLIALVGWPAAVLMPSVPAVHALRLFGRLESDTDRSWMIFLAGIVALLPIAVALAIGTPPAGEISGAAGLWGGFVAFYWRQFLGGFGAWVVVALAVSALAAATLRWNPVRMLVGRKAMPVAPAASEPVEEPYAPPRRRRKKGEPQPLALALEGSPEEFASIGSDPLESAMRAPASAEADAKEEAAI